MHRYSLVGSRRWPAWVWTAATIIGPLAVYVRRSG